MINITPAAARELKRLQRKQAATAQPVVLQLSLQTGGCATWTYVMNYVERPQGDATRFDVDGTAVFLSQQALPLLEGLTIDYGEDLMGGNFRFMNPNAGKTCGCGVSFSLQDEVD